MFKLSKFDFTKQVEFKVSTLSAGPPLQLLAEAFQAGSVAGSELTLSDFLH